MSEIYTITKPAPQTQEPDLFSEPNANFDNLNYKQDSEHDWVLTTAEVAQGYGVSESNIREHKNNGEFIENKHFFSRVGKTDAGNLKRVQTLWTKKGVVRLGFFIKSKRAKEFRDFCEDLVLNKKTTMTINITVPQTFSEALLLAGRLQAEKEANQPLIAFAEAVRESKNGITIGQFAKVCNTGEYKLFKWLRDNNYLIASGPSLNLPKQTQLNNGNFITREVVIGNGETRFQTLITGKGQLVLEPVVREFLNKN